MINRILTITTPFLKLAVALIVAGMLWRTYDLGHPEPLRALIAFAAVYTLYALYMFGVAGILRLMGGWLLHAANHIDAQHQRGKEIAQAMIRRAVEFE